MLEKLKPSLLVLDPVVFPHHQGHVFITSGDPQHPHDAYDGRVDGQRSIQVNFLKRDAHDGEKNNGQV